MSSVEIAYESRTWMSTDQAPTVGGTARPFEIGEFVLVCGQRIGFPAPPLGTLARVSKDRSWGRYVLKFDDPALRRLQDRLYHAHELRRPFAPADQ